MPLVKRAQRRRLVPASSHVCVPALFGSCQRRPLPPSHLGTRSHRQTLVDTSAVAALRATPYGGVVPPAADMLHVPAVPAASALHNEAAFFPQRPQRCTRRFRTTFRTCRAVDRATVISVLFPPQRVCIPPHRGGGVRAVSHLRQRRCRRRSAAASTDVCVGDSVAEQRQAAHGADADRGMHATAHLRRGRQERR